MSTTEKQSKRGWSQLVEHGPNWIKAITAVFVALVAAGGGGYVAGRTIQPDAPAAAAKTVTVTTTVTAPPSSTPTSPPSSSQPAVANGTELGSYPVSLPYYYSVPLGPVAPTQSQFVHGGADGSDIFQAGVFSPNSGNKMLNLPGGSTPTYQSCAAQTVFETQANTTPGTAFCLVETGRMVGITVTSLSTGQPSYVVMHVTVWQNQS